MVYYLLFVLPLFVGVYFHMCTVLMNKVLVCSMIPSSQKEVVMPTLVTLAASLQKFQCPFATTIIPKSPKLSNVSDEESLDKARSYLIEGIHLLNEASTRTKARTDFITNHQLKFEEGMWSLKQLCEIHERIEEEAKELHEKVSGLSERNQLLVCDLSESSYFQDESFLTRNFLFG